MNQGIDVDLSRASRIARRVELNNIIMMSLNAGIENWVQGGTLYPVVSPACGATVHGSTVTVTCRYSFEARSGEQKVAGADISYLLIYDLLGDEACDEGDLKHFANANGIYHSWPFLRQTLFDLTVKMDLPPFKLPVMYFGSRKAQNEGVVEGGGEGKAGGKAAAKSSQKKRPPDRIKGQKQGSVRQSQ